MSKGPGVHGAYCSNCVVNQEGKKPPESDTNIPVSASFYLPKKKMSTGICLLFLVQGPCVGTYKYFAHHPEITR